MRRERFNQGRIDIENVMVDVEPYNADSFNEARWGPNWEDDI